MSFRVGLLLILAVVLIAIFTAHGSFGVFLQIDEYIVILGLGFASFVTSNSGDVQKNVAKQFVSLFSKKSMSKKEYMDILSFSFKFLTYMNTNSAAQVEEQIENATQSELFTKSAIMMNNKKLRDFFCDCMRILCLGVNDAISVDDMIENRLSSIRDTEIKPSKAITALSEAFPGIGLVAAVLGIVLALASAGDDPAILAAKIASAMVGTLLGIFLSYAVFGPIGSRMKVNAESNMKPFESMRIVIISHVYGQAPSICVEFARQIIPEYAQPSFTELENFLQGSDASAE